MNKLLPNENVKVKDIKDYMSLTDILLIPSQDHYRSVNCYEAIHFDDCPVVGWYDVYEIHKYFKGE